ncbi:putative C6 transcription factor [Paraphoma chrysanthemicola]|uniref:C6 transcription factor n=1 Tax=Paraphoma chrysanthemicola TaxID=798071 RepID=A0A8K0R543_9PLEO|nr:putative C6 transcription factor [Paraphoma chrysanthemicola]
MARCKRNKSRCDPYRPVKCANTASELQTRPTKRKQVGETTQARADIEARPAEEPLRSEESRRPSVSEGQVDSAMGIAQRIYQLSGQGTPVLRRTTSAIPGGDIYSRQAATRAERNQRRPIAAIIGYAFPEADTMRLLLEEYFDSVHWFSLVIYEPRFRLKFESITDGLAYPAQKSFLLLVSVVLGLGAWYRSRRFSNNHEDWASSLVQGAGSQLTELMDQASIASVQACILLGSYYVYHGKPNLSFSLLGATIRTAQAIGLHRQPLRGDSDSVEERKRVWWTIYTWDRFASVTYGRPLGINDRDCNVAQPADTHESPFFGVNGARDDSTTICYSSYQRELNKLYLTASSVIETIFGMRTMGHGDHTAGHQYLAKVMDATDRLWAWRRRLPPHLLLDLNSDCEANTLRSSKVHRLQALALQLTFDNLLIIFHRPSLAYQVEQLIRNQPDHGQNSTPSPSSVHHTTTSVSPLFTTSGQSPLSVSQASSTEQWWEAALRTSKVTQLPQLAQLATDSHLVAFLAINLFNSAIVMAVLALSDPLSDRAQEVKRSITRIFRLQELLGKKTELSMQSNVVLKDVIHMLLQREADAMLAPINDSNPPRSTDGETAQMVSEVPLLSVEETLRLPIDANQRHQQAQHTTSKALRLNESLASVQRVFPFTAEVSSELPIHTGDHDHDSIQPQPFDVGNGALSEATFQGITGDVDFGWSDDANVDITGNGLYWFWDTAWGDGRS